MNRKRVVIAAVILLIVVVILAIVMRQAESGDARLNVLLITLDTTRADRIGCYGYDEALTPALDQLADNGVLFEQAFACVPLTLPSHATILTGLQPAEHSLRVNAAGRLAPDVPVMAQLFRDKGYHTAAFIASFALDSDFGLERGFDTYDDDLTGAYAVHAADPISQYRSGDLVTDSALAWLEQQGDEPFFCWVHLYDPHLPYFTHEALSGTRFSGQRTYDAEVAFMDLQVARLMTFLKQRNRVRNTLVVAVGDHGEGLGEHEELGHGYLLYDTTMRVPLVFSAPGRIPQRLRINAIVSLADLFPTILDFLDIPRPEQITGRSLKPALLGETIDSVACYGETNMPYATFGWCPQQSLTTPAFKYIRTNRPELYDRNADPYENTNLATTFPDKVKELEAELSAVEAAMVYHLAQDIQLSDENRRRLESLGYVAPRHGTVDTKTLDLSALKDMKDVIPVIDLIKRKDELLDQGKTDELVEVCREMVRLSPNSARIRLFLAGALDEAGQSAEAIEEYHHCVQLDPEDQRALGSLALALGRAGETSQAIEQFNALLKLNPDDVKAHCHLAILLVGLEQTDEAFKHATRAIELNPDFPGVRSTLAAVLAKRGDLPGAIEQYQKIIQADPTATGARQNLANLFLTQGNIQGAIDQFRQLVELAPDELTPLLRLAQLLATHQDAQYRDGPEAVRLAQRACELTGYQEASVLDLLGAAYAETGQFDQARITATKAYELALAAGNQQLAQLIQKRLALYQQGKPFHQSTTGAQP